jgi:hypothetical protein
MPQSKQPAARKDTTARKKAKWLLLLAARALVLLLAMQLSGMNHSVIDSVRSFAGCGEDHGDCSSDESGRDCPPGCPTCHHPHGGVGALPSEQVLNFETPPPLQVTFAPAEADAPPNPDLPAVFRPPKRA